MRTSTLKRSRLLTLLLGLLGAGVINSAQADLSIANGPLYLGASIPPNIMFILDDSGSMLRAYMPDGIGMNCDKAVPIQSFGSSSTRQYWNNLVDPDYYYQAKHETYGGKAIFVCTAITTTEGGHNRYFMSSALNKVYYNPNATYLPPLKSDGTPYSDASFTNAKVDGFDASSGTVNLSSNYRVLDGENEIYSNTAIKITVSASSIPSGIRSTVADDLNNKSNCNGSGSGNSRKWTCTVSQYNKQSPTPSGRYLQPPAGIYYYDYDRTSDPSLCNVTPPSSNGACYIGRGLSTDEQKKNFANWFSYYRTRELMAKTGVHRAFAVLNGAQRIGYGRINNNTNWTRDGVKTKTVLRGVRDFTGSDRQAFFDWLAAVSSSGGTPLRRALDDVGKYFEREDDKGPWSDKPGVGGTVSEPATLQSCRQSYTILTTDGYWNGDAAPTSDARLNQDNMAGATITGPGGMSYVYTPVSPFRDNWAGTSDSSSSGTLADIAMYYWKRDLTPNIPNRVPTNPIDPAFWQHMVVFGVGMGVSGAVNPNTAFDAINTGTAVSWPDPRDGEDEDRIDDLLHAGVNSRGGFFSAQNPKEFADALTSTLRSIQSRTSSAAALTTNTTKLEAGSRVYQARFNSEDWTGQLLAYQLTTTGQPASVVWDAAQQIPAHGSRKIFTWNGSSGVTLTWDNLTSTQKEELKKDKYGVVGSDTDGQARLNWVRGDRSQEQANGGVLRDRSVVLGDIVNSDPQYAGNVDYDFGKLGTTAGEAYATYLETKKAGPQVVYVQANDGMLHAVDASNGQELFAYLPSYFMRSNVDSKLRQLTDPDYQHRYYLDGQIFVGDAYINGSWRSILVGTAGAGGRFVYALDVTNPTSFSASNVLWEFSDLNDSDMGFVLGQATLVYLKNTKWAVVFGNGYNSANNEAVLMVLELNSDDAKIQTVKKVKTGVKTNNGLSSTVLLSDEHRNVVTAYAGDMQGNMWKFDLSDTNPDSAFKSASKPVPLFTAKDGNGYTQSITAPPQVRKHPTGGYLLVFGTGQYFVQGDNSTTNVPSYQSLYGIRDNNSRITYTSSRDEVLQKQEILSEDTVGEWQVRVTSQNTVDWSSKKGWYLDLLTPGNPPTNEGERVIEQALVRYDRAIFTTMKTSGDDCSFGGESWIIEIDTFSGGRLNYAALDLNDDSLFDEGDMVAVTDAQGQQQMVPVSAIRSTQGVLSEPNVILGPVATLEYKMASGTSGNIQVIREKGFDSSDSTSRTSWRQLEQ